VIEWQMSSRRSSVTLQASQTALRYNITLLSIISKFNPHRMTAQLLSPFHNDNNPLPTTFQCFRR